MAFYENTIIARQDLAEKDIKAVKEKYNEIIANSSGKVVKIEEWGLLNLANKIKNYKKGFYIHYKFEGNSKTLTEKPILCRASTIICVSSLQRAPVRVVSPLANAARIRARLVILLDPGTVICEATGVVCGIISISSGNGIIFSPHPPATDRVTFCFYRKNSPKHPPP